MGVIRLDVRQHRIKAIDEPAYFVFGFLDRSQVKAALLAIPALGEWPKPVDWLGIVVITVGVYLASGGPLPTRLMRALR
jgi:drug/metabolite transporter (DMT)-like permease